VIRPTAAMLLLGVGVAFITVASLGVARMPDVFQRMHAATKAGGIGTSLVVLGVLVAGGVARPLTGVLTILFMLLTLSVASQLLARAAYMSGAPLHGLDRGDPLGGVLDRAARAPVEDSGPPTGIDGSDAPRSRPTQRAP
jgi:multicomponent Na+:H+ antiporter subunit G